MKSIKEYLPVLQKISKVIIGEHQVDSEAVLEKIYRSNQKVLTIFNHSTPLSWLPVMTVMAEKACRYGGGDRIPLSVMDQYFFKNPLLRPLAQYMTQAEDRMSFDEILNSLNNSVCTDLALFPEGSNCFFGDSEKIQPFRSPRFIELSLRSQMPILLVVHRGSEGWAKSIPVKSTTMPLKAYLPGWFNEKLERSSGRFVLPTVPRKIGKFRMKCEIFEPELQLIDLSENREHRREQLWREAHRVHEKMQQMFDALAV